ncbi:2-dehydropantoate 2-reductase N-terminal domain-containing protein [Micromonospora sp. WMMD1102]|uniref:ketopantoate reductase family protein n=1 Tax=Micromonospora sp. WMMD1102 TaxID=3016105 RepID=UPI002414E053|nr:2-dehydropantoate 2-reductase N-terminal domain-containing protein [Micromonospora sp. WMMD1102]MDG4784522.1 2-dehydropantoate 2-reductase N-terminal domain-containing protein [Micromonospora sp. WMMD1102]
MRYVIIGAGAVGGTIGVRLGEAGRDVTLVARGAHLAAIRAHGLALDTPDGGYLGRLPAVGDPASADSGIADLLLTPDTVLVLTVKSQDTEAALHGWADLPVRGGGTAAERLPLLTAQNGVANERAAARIFERVYPVCVWMPATHLEPGRVVASGHPYSGMLHLGAFPHGSDDLAHEVSADLTAARLLAPVRDDVMRWKYGKLLRNLGNGVQALFGSVDAGASDGGASDRRRTESGKDRVGRVAELLSAVVAEGEAVLEAAGIGYTSRPEEAAERGDRVESAPVAGQPRQGSSTWQSLARNAGSVETDYLNGEIVLLGRLHGVPTPANAAVQRAMRRTVRERIPAGEFPIAELADRQSPP